ncbi:serine/threonine protein kinase [Ramlibacter henchirensis]|uniref:Stress response kinase A n=1 Tax=Ramlibacter henchirensis TaxID=204072 RepID=A0A4Z0C5G3_9BURK|nr:serine/threonine protein kinase [Ramlibacter henchirensis]TFZ06521.1 serine/threonine protein kinase [Ramlibacter henchirensis]
MTAPARDNAGMSATHPYQALTPDVVLDALASVGLHGDGRLMALSSYENRVYQAALEEPAQGHAQVVAKFYRPGRWSEEAIREEHDFSRALAEAEVPAVAPLVLEGGTLHHHAGFAFSVSPRRGGRRPELDDEEVLEWIGRFLARIHTVGAAEPFANRPVLDLRSFGTESRDWLLQRQIIPMDVERVWREACDAALNAVEHAMGGKSGAYAPQFKMLRLHGDCHPGNILWTPDEGPHFVDLDDARTGPAVQDLWMLLSGERAQRQRQLGALLDGYEQVRDFDRQELVLVEPLRTLRLIHYSAWLARRWDDPAFPAAFPYFGSSDYWKGQVLMLEEQLEAMAEPPMVA